MPTLESAWRYQKAVLWTASTTRDNYGRVKVNAAAEITVRWEEDQREALDPEGKTIAIDATVFADREIALASIMWLGKLTALPSPTVDLFQVATRSRIPDIKNRNVKWEYGLIRHGDSLPPTV